jgi:hypothetical protein
MDGYAIKNSMTTCKNKNSKDIVEKIVNLGDNKVIYNNINELIEREYYSKYINKSTNLTTPLSIYEKEILDNYSNILYKNVL